MPTTGRQFTEQDGSRLLDGYRGVLDLEAEDAFQNHKGELPVRPWLTTGVDRDLGAEMGLPPEARLSIRLCRNALLLSLQEARTLGLNCVHYARDRNAYGRNLNLPDYWTYAAVMAAIESLTAMPAIIGHDRVLPQNPHLRSFQRRRSSIFAGPDFVDDVGYATVLSSPSDAGHRMLIRDARGQAKPIPDRPLIATTKAFLGRFDGFVDGAALSLADPSIRWLSPAVGVVPVGIQLHRVDLGRRHLIRIFNSSLRRGGRWYRGFWQDMPKRLRPSLLINGEAVFECDFSACHLRLAYYAVGAGDELRAFGDEDLYRLPGFEPKRWRRAIKVGVQIALNARSEHATLGALAAFLPQGSWEQRLSEASALIAAIKETHPALRPVWHCGIGLGLQFVDSEIVRLCLEELMGHGILGLPVHDSIMVAAPHGNLLVEVMTRRFKTEGRMLAASHFSHLRKRGFRGHDLTDGRGRGGRGGVGRESAGTTEKDVAESAFASRPLNEAESRVLDDLEKLIRSRRGWCGSIVRSALLTFATGSSTRPVAVDRTSAWATQVSARSNVALRESTADPEIARFLSRKATPIAPPSIARLCRVSPSEAQRLNLGIILPKRRRARADPGAARRAARIGNGRLPRIVDVEASKPWLRASVGRSTWFADTTDPVERQVLALEAVIMDRSPESVAAACDKIAAARSARSLVDCRRRLPVDDLLDRLDAVMARNAARDRRRVNPLASPSGPFLEACGEARLWKICIMPTLRESVGWVLCEPGLASPRL